MTNESVENDANEFVAENPNAEGMSRAEIVAQVMASVGPRFGELEKRIQRLEAENSHLKLQVDKVEGFSEKIHKDLWNHQHKEV